MEELRVQRWFWRVWTIIGAGILLIAVWWLLREPFAIVAAPIALAAIIVYLVNPFVGFLAHRRVPRLLGTLLAYIVVAGGIVALAAVVGPTLVDQTGEFIERAPEILAAVQDWANARIASLGLDFRLTFDPESQATQNAVTDFFRENREQILDILRGAGTVLGRIFHGVLTLILAPFLAFYVLADLPRISAGIKRLVPPGQRSEVVEVTQRIGRTVGAYFRGQLLVASFVAVATSIGLLIIDLPFWALVGPLTGLFNLIPLIGPFVGGAIGVIIALTVGGGTGQALAVVIVMTVVQQVDNHVITPNIVSRTVEVHPVTVILGLLVAGSLFGIVGMFIAIPAIAATKLVVMYLLVTRVPSMSHLAEEGPGLFEDDDGDGRGDAGGDEERGLFGMARDLRRTWEQRRRPRTGDESVTQTEVDVESVGAVDEDRTST